jgi:hypothetical protein
LLNSAWKDNTWSYDWLRKMATGKRSDIISWLKEIGIMPHETRWRRSPMSIYNGLDRDAISATALAELAYEFDTFTRETGVKEFPTHKEFVDWLAYEIKGHPKREQFMSVMSTLGRRGPVATS